MALARDSSARGWLALGLQRGAELRCSGSSGGGEFAQATRGPVTRCIIPLREKCPGGQKPWGLPSGVSGGAFQGPETAHRRFHFGGDAVAIASTAIRDIFAVSIILLNMAQLGMASGLVVAFVCGLTPSLGHLEHYRPDHHSDVAGLLNTCFGGRTCTRHGCDYDTVICESRTEVAQTFTPKASITSVPERHVTEQISGISTCHVEVVGIEHV